MTAERQLVRIQKDGRVTLPADIRKRLDLKEGDLVVVEEKPEGVLITTRGIAAINDLTRIGDALREQGLTLEDMIESGREIREELFREKYGHLDTDSSHGLPRK